MDKKGYFSTNTKEKIANTAEYLGFKLETPKNLNRIEIGDYTLLDPNEKNIHEAFQKIWRVLDKRNINETIDINHLNLVSDYVRCAVLVPEFQETPKLLDVLLKQFGGIIKIHNRNDYKAFHIHFQIPFTTDKQGNSSELINCEIQIHTPETHDLKMLTDQQYHKWRREKAKDKVAVENNPEYIKELEIINPLCNEIYNDSGFNETLPEIERMKEGQPSTLPATDMEDALLTVSYASIVQKRLINFMTQLLKDMVKRRESIINHEELLMDKDLVIPVEEEVLLHI